MKTSTKHSTAKKSYLILIMLLILFIIPFKNLTAGQAKWINPVFFQQDNPSQEIDPSTQFYASFNYFMFLKLQNANGSYPVNNIEVYVYIMNMATFSYIWTMEYFVASLSPLSYYTITTSDNPFMCTEPGNYRLFMSLSSPDDVDPENNTMTFDFTVLPAPLPDLPVDVIIEQVDYVSPFQQPNSTTGIFNFNCPSQSQPMFINVMAQQENSEISPAWLVQNMPILPFPDNQDLSTFVNFESIGVENGQDLTTLEFDLKFTTTILTEKWLPEVWYTTEVENTTVDIGDKNPVEGDPEPEFESVIADLTWDSPTVITWHYRGCDVPNIDLVSTTYHPTSTPGYAGDKNACGPAACANSMQWLENKNDNIPANDESHREKMVDLSKLMNRVNEEGVNTDQMVLGKLAYIDKHQLPIHVKFQSHFLKKDSVKSPNASYKHFADNQTGEGGKPDFDWIRSEMQKGEDVEIMFGWYDSTGRRHGGHWVALSGVSDVGTGKGFYFKDDLDQSNEGGNRQVYVNWLEGNNGWSRLVGLEGVNNYCWVESAISESYDPTISFEILEPKVKKVNMEKTFQNPYPLLGIFDFSYLPRDEGAYLNVFMKKSENDGDFWNIRNLFLPPFNVEQSLSTYFDLADLGIQSADEISSLFVNWFVSDEPIVEETEVERSWYDELMLGTYDFIKKLNVEDNLLPTLLNLAIDIPNVEFPSFITGYKTRYHYRGCEVPNIDLDSSEYNPVKVPGYAGDLNACVPVATANSMQWLENKYPQIKSNISHREKLVELSKLMKRENNEGTSTDNFIKGKLAYIDKYKLPIKVKFQSKFYDANDVNASDTTYHHSADNRNTGEYKSPDFEFLMKEIKDDEDVEIIYGYYTRDSTKREGGHCITVTGVSDVGTAKGFYFKDDTNQEGIGGTKQTYVNWDTVNGWVTLKQLYTDTHFALVESVVSESYDSTVTFDIQNPKVEKVAFVGDPSLTELHLDESPKGIFSFDFIPSTIPRIFNLLMRPDEKYPASWIIRNLLLPPSATTENLSYWFNFDQLKMKKDSIIDLKTVEFAFVVSDSTKETLTIEDPIWAKIKIDTLWHDIKLNTEDNFNADTIKPAPIDTSSINHGNNIKYNYRGSEMPNIDLDSSSFNPDKVEGYAGDLNACGPAAAANSMQWLDNKFGEINSGISHREKLVELSKLMNRTNNNGVYTENFIQAKLDYIDKYKLPIQVKFQSIRFEKDSIPANADYGHYARNHNTAANAHPTFEWLEKEIKDDEDVEVEFGYYDSTGTRRGGHWVTVSGTYSNNTSNSVYIKDDLYQRVSGGTREQTVSWAIKNGKPYFKEISGSNYTCYIESVVSESPDTSIKFYDPPKITGIRVVDRFIDDAASTLKEKFSIVVSPLYEGLKYLNIFGQSSEGVVQVVKNLPLSREDAQSPEIMVDKSAFIDNANTKSTKIENVISIGIQATDEPVTDNPKPDYWTDVTVEVLGMTQSNDIQNTNGFNLTEPELGSLPSFENSDFSMIRQLVPIDLDASTHGVNQPDSYKGDLNSGGLAAIVNAMMQLGVSENAITIEESPRELQLLIDLLSVRDAGQGITTQGLIESTLACIDSLQYQVKLMYQSQSVNGQVNSPNKRYGHYAFDAQADISKSPSWDWMKARLKDESIILCYGYYDSNGNRLGGQAAAISTLSESGSNKSLQLSIDLEQGNIGGNTTIAVNWIETDGNALLYQLSTPNFTCWVESAIVLAYDPSISFIETGLNTILNPDFNLKVYRNPSLTAEEVTIEFTTIAHNTNAIISILDITGRKIKTIERNYLVPGVQNITWDGFDENQLTVAPGNYIVHLDLDSKTSNVKIQKIY